MQWQAEYDPMSPARGTDASHLPPEVPNHEILNWIGSGSFGEVWLARDIMGVHRAVKVVRRAKFVSDKPFDREFEGLRNFEPVSRKHEGLMDITGMGRNDAAGYFFYVMEAADDQVAGQDIQPETYRPKTLLSEFSAKGRLPFQACLDIALSLSNSLEHLHKRGLVHRDIKPANIIFVNDVPKLADIGLVTSSRSAATFIGSPGYIAPEGPGSPQADIYALGKVLYEIVTGYDRLDYPKPPEDLEDNELQQFQELNAIVLKACESDPAKRYQSAEKMHEDLLLLQGGKSVRQLRKFERTGKRALLAAGAIIVVSLVAFGLQREQANQHRRELNNKLLLSLSTRIRIGPRENDWSVKALQLASSVAGISRKEQSDDIRNQIAALMGGLDAHQSHATNLPASSIQFDGETGRLLIGGIREPFPQRDILDLTNLAQRLYQPAASDGVSLYIREQLRSTTLGRLSNYLFGLSGKLQANDMEVVTTRLRQALAREFSNIIEGPSIREKLDFNGVNHSAETQALLKEVSTGEKLFRLNRLLLEEAYPAEIRRRNGALGWGASLWEPSANAMHSSSRSAFGPASLSKDGTAVELLYDAENRLILVVAALSDRTNRVWTIPEQIGASRLIGNPSLLALAQGGACAAAVFTNTTGQHVLSLFQSDVPVCLGTFLSPVSAIAFSPDGSRMAAAHTGGGLEVWSMSEGQHLHTLPAGREKILSMALKHVERTFESRSGVERNDGKWLLAAGHLGGGVTVWDLDSGTIIAQGRGAYMRTDAVAFNPDGTILASGGRGTIKLWDISRGAEHLLDINSDSVSGLDFSPDGRKLAVASKSGFGEGSVSIWDLEFGRGIQTLRGLSTRVEKVCFSRDGRTIAAFSHFWEIGVWDVASDRLVRVFEAPQNEYPDNVALAFSPDGRRLVFAGERMAKMWDVRSGGLLGCWQLWSGLCNIPRFSDGDHLTLFRLEGSTNSNEPFWEVSATENPRVCRIPQLVVPGETNTIAMITNFDRRVFGAVAPPDGRCFVVAGLSSYRKEPGFKINCYNRVGGKIWELTSTSTGDGVWLTVDSGGKVITVPVDDSRGSALLDLASGSKQQRLPWMPNAMNDGASLYVVPSYNHPAFATNGYSYALCMVPGGSPVVGLGVDNAAPPFPEFDATGNLLAWGNQDGTVTVCDLPAIRGRLNQLKLGW